MEKRREIELDINHVVEIYDILLGAGLSQEEINKVMNDLVYATAAKINEMYNKEKEREWIRYIEPLKKPAWMPAEKPGTIRWWTNPTCTLDDAVCRVEINSGEKE